MKKLMGLLMVLALTAGISFGAAATAAVDTPSRKGDMSNYGVATNTRIFAGTMVALNSSGYAVPAADTSGHIVIGRAAKTVDNRTGQAGAGDNGALTINVERGIFGWTGRGISADTAVGSICYVFDDNSVTNGAGDNAVIAGVVVDYSDGKVWVDTYNIGRTAGSFTTLAASGAATLASTLAVSGNSTLGGTTVAVTNNATIGGTLAITKTLGVTGIATFAARPAFTVADSTAATNATPTVSLPITINGTNYLLKAFPN